MPPVRLKRPKDPGFRSWSLGNDITLTVRYGHPPPVLEAFEPFLAQMINYFKERRDNLGEAQSTKRAALGGDTEKFTCGWLQCNAYSDSNGTIYPSLRTSFSATGTSNRNYGNVQGIINTSLLDLGSGSNYTQSMALVLPVLNERALVGGQNGMDWSDGRAMMLEPLIAWPTSSSGGQALIRGQ